LLKTIRKEYEETYALSNIQRLGVTNMDHYQAMCRHPGYHVTLGAAYRRRFRRVWGTAWCGAMFAVILRLTACVRLLVPEATPTLTPLGTRMTALMVGQRLDAARLEALRIKNVLREVCRDLRSDLLDLLGLGAALRRHVHDLIRSHEVVICLDLPPGHIELPDAVEIALFRICQEALANAVAHAGVREVWVCLWLDAGSYNLSI
jgi:hypothetical protein